MAGLHIIIGNAGSGKTSGIVSRIKQTRDKDRFRRIFVITPEQYTYSMEKLLMDDGMLMTEVLSFSRLAHRITEDLLIPEKNVLSEQGRSMLIRRIIDGQKMSYFKDNIRLQGFIEEIKSFISELMQYGITPEDLGGLIGGGSLDKGLMMRLSDIRLIYAEFIKYLEEHNEIVSGGGTSLAAEGLRGEGLQDMPGRMKSVIDGADFYFDGFTGFEPHQYELFREILARSGDVYITVTMDTGDISGAGSNALFRMSLDYIGKAESIALELGIRSSREYIAGSGRFEERGDLKAIESGIFRSRGERYDSSPENVRLCRLRNPSSEIDYVISVIRENLASGNIRYNDVAIIAGNLNEYGDIASAAMKRAGIPVFIDSKERLIRDPFSSALTALLVAAEKGCDYSSMITLIRSDFLREKLLGGIWTPEYLTYITDILDNFLIASGLRGRAVWEREWSTGIISKSDRIKGAINDLREKAANELGPAIDGLIKMSTASERLDIIDTFFGAENLPGAYKAVADDMRMLLGGIRLSISEFRKILLTGIAAAETGELPPDDAVIVCDSMRSRIDAKRIIFFVGASAENVPRVVSDGGLISDRERREISGSVITGGKVINLAPGREERMDEDKFHLYLNLTKATDKLYITVPELSSDGSRQSPAYLVNRIREILPAAEMTYPEKDDPVFRVIGSDVGEMRLADELRYLREASPEASPEALSVAEEVWPSRMEELGSKGLFSDNSGTIAEDIARSLYSYVTDAGETVESRMSVSQMESFAGCPFRYFMNYGLRAKERKEREISAADIGSIVHNSLDALTQLMKAENRDWADYEGGGEERFRDLCGQAFSDAVSSYEGSGEMLSERERRLLARFGETFRRTAEHIRSQMVRGDYRTLASEMKFTMDRPVRLVGKVDRIDTADSEGREYVNVIDYKTGNHDVSLTELCLGIQMQLAVYLGRAAEDVKARNSEEGVKKIVIPAGMFYYNIKDGFEDILKKDKNVMKGIFSGNEEAIGHIDRAMVTGDDELRLAGGETSEVIPLSITKEGLISGRSIDRVMDEKELSDIISYAGLKMQEIDAKRLSGDSRIEPYMKHNRSGEIESMACSFCPYNSVCGHDMQKGNYNEIYEERKSASMKRIRESLGGEGADGE